MNSDQTKAITALSSIIMLDPDMAARIILADMRPSRNCCRSCHREIPPGRAGRQCQGCRESPPAEPVVLTF